MSLVSYLPILFRLLQHKDEIERILTDAQPLMDEFQRVWPRLLPQLRAVIPEIFPDGPAEVSNVKWLQVGLNERGFGPLAEDGVYGPQTSDAVSRFLAALILSRERANGNTTD